MRIYIALWTPGNASCGSRLSPIETKNRPSLFLTTRRRCTTNKQTDRQTDVYLYFVSEGAGNARPGSFFGRRGGGDDGEQKKSCGFRGCCASSRPQGGRATTMIAGGTVHERKGIPSSQRRTAVVLNISTIDESIGYTDAVIRFQNIVRIYIPLGTYGNASCGSR